MKKQFTLGEIAKHIGAELKGDPTQVIYAIGTVDTAQSGELSFITEQKYLSQLKASQATAVIIHPNMVDQAAMSCLIHHNPYLGYAKAAELFEYKPALLPTIHPTAIIGHDCQLAHDIYIGPYVVIGDRVVIGEGTKIHAATIIGDDCNIGQQCELKPRVTLYSDVTIGEHCIIHSGAVLGSDGFGNAKDGDAWYKIPQLGGVRIGHDVEIGANTTIDRGAIAHTVIKQGVRIDNLVQIAHNVQIGAYTAIAACTGIAGSTIIGEHCLFGGMVGVTGHLEISDRAVFTAMSLVTRSVDEPGIYSSGTGLLKNKAWHRAVVYFRNIDEWVKRLKVIEKKLETLED